MDLLEYQGKQLFKKHGVPVPEGRPASTVPEAAEAAEQLGYPVVVKAQVLIGGRGKAGGIKLAKDRAEVEEHAGNILGMDIRGFTVHELYIEKASDIADRKSTRLNSSHANISYAVFCLKKKKHSLNDIYFSSSSIYNSITSDLPYFLSVRPFRCFSPLCVVLSSCLSSLLSVPSTFHTPP